MTEPAPDLNPIPDGFQAWTVSGCTFPVGTGKWCGTEDTETLSRLGRRCADHPPLFDPTTAVELVRDGWTDTAMSYVRWAADPVRRLHELERSDPPKWYERANLDHP